jgi:hypothetical protein
MGGSSWAARPCRSHGRRCRIRRCVHLAVRICNSTRWRRADHGGVDRAVVVLLGRRDVVLEAARHHRPGRVDDPERAVAVLDLIDDDAEAENVGELLEGDRFALHLAEDRIRLLAPAGRPAPDAVLFGSFSLRSSRSAMRALRFALGQLGQPLGHGRVIGFRIDVAEGQFLQLLAHACMPMRPASGA